MGGGGRYWGGGCSCWLEWSMGCVIRALEDGLVNAAIGVMILGMGESG